jgi:hypothetical protein
MSAVRTASLRIRDLARRRLPTRPMDRVHVFDRDDRGAVQADRIGSSRRAGARHTPFRTGRIVPG